MKFNQSVSWDNLPIFHHHRKTYNHTLRRELMAAAATAASSFFSISSSSLSFRRTPFLSSSSYSSHHFPSLPHIKVRVLISFSPAPVYFPVEYNRLLISLITSYGREVFGGMVLYWFKWIASRTKVDRTPNPRARQQRRLLRRDLLLLMLLMVFMMTRALLHINGVWVLEESDSWRPCIWLTLSWPVLMLSAPREGALAKPSSPVTTHLFSVLLYLILV